MHNTPRTIYGHVSYLQFCSFFHLLSFSPTTCTTLYTDVVDMFLYWPATYCHNLKWFQRNGTLQNSTQVSSLSWYVNIANTLAQSFDPCTNMWIPKMIMFWLDSLKCCFTWQMKLLILSQSGQFFPFRPFPSSQTRCCPAVAHHPWGTICGVLIHTIKRIATHCPDRHSQHSLTPPTFLKYAHTPNSSSPQTNAIYTGI